MEKKGTELTGIQKRVKNRSERFFHRNGKRRLKKYKCKVNKEYYFFSKEDNLCDFLEK